MISLRLQQNTILPMNDQNICLLMKHVYIKDKNKYEQFREFIFIRENL